MGAEDPTIMTPALMRESGARRARGPYGRQSAQGAVFGGAADFLTDSIPTAFSA